MEKIMKKFLKGYLLAMMMFAITLIPFSRVFAKDKIVEDLEKGGTIDVNVVNPNNLTKTLNYFKEEYIKSISSDMGEDYQKERTEWANSFFTPQGEAVWDVLTAYISSQIKEQDAVVSVYDCDKDYNCKVSIDFMDGFQGSRTQTKDYNVKFNFIGKYDSKVEEEMIEIYKKINNMDSQGSFTLEDINMIDYLYNLSNDNLSMTYLLQNSINFTEAIKEINNKNYNFFLLPKLGESFPSMIGAGSEIMFGDKNSIYFVSSPNAINPASFGLGYNYIIYIDESTPETTEDYINAAKKRINDYYGKEVVDIKFKESLKDTVEKDCNYQCSYESLAEDEYVYGKFKMLPNMYTVTFNNKEYSFLIVKDNTKLSYPKGIDTIDSTTNVAIESTSNSIPLDSKIEINLYTKDSEEFKKIEDTHKEYNFYDVFDIKLFSKAADKYITKLDDGYFRVKLPSKKEYEGKELYAYYFNENGETEKYKVTQENGYIYFDTKHFSVYSIGEEKPLLDSTPKTGIKDYSALALIITLISFCGIVKLRKN